MLDIEYCLDRGLMRQVSFSSDSFRVLIKNETIHYFTLLDPMMTSVHDPANWTYILEGQGDTNDAPRSPPMEDVIRWQNRLLYTGFSFFVRKWRSKQQSPSNFILSNKGKGEKNSKRPFEICF